MKKLAFVLLAVLILPSAFAADYTDDIRILVPVVRRTSEGVFRDAITYSKAEYDAKTNAEIKADGDARAAAWVAAVQAAKTRPPVVPTRAELQAERDRLAAELAVIESRLAAR